MPKSVWLNSRKREREEQRKSKQKEKSVKRDELYEEREEREKERKLLSVFFLGATCQNKSKGHSQKRYRPFYILVYAILKPTKKL